MYSKDDRYAGGYRSYCKTCGVKKYTGPAVRRRYIQRTGDVNALKDVPCADCKQRFSPVCMDFDHVRGMKVAAISQILAHRWDRVLAEIAKCEIVCANCHRIRTLERKRAKRAEVERQRQG